MSNKYLLLPFLGVLVPIALYFFWSGVFSASEIFIPPIGEVQNDEVIIPTAELVTIAPKLKPIVFVGDVLLARNVEFLITKHGLSYPFLNTPSIFAVAPFVVGNFESAVLKNHVKTPSFVTTFSVNSKFLSLLPEAGFTHVSLANNHSLDYGTETFAHTVEKISTAGVLTFGHPQNVSSSSVTIIETGGKKIGLLALNRIFSNLSWIDIQTIITDVNQNTDYLIVYVHWGEEYVLKHSAAQEEFAVKLLDAGVDAIIGHHPHVTQDIQIHNNKPIFYSLGNFLFDQYFSVDVTQGLVVQFEIKDDAAEFTLIPVSSEGTPSQPHKMEPDQAALFLQNLARRSDKNFAHNIAQGKLILPLSLATSTQNGMIAQ